MKQISVIIPVYNTPAEYLRACLDSVLRQNYACWEAILVDDGSNNGAESICDEYAAKDARFRVIHQRQNGVSAARNAGLDAAKGDWLIFLDADDWWEENLLSSAVGRLKEEDADLLVFAFHLVQSNQTAICGIRTGKNKPADATVQETLQLGLLNRNARVYGAYTGALWMQMIRREAVNGIRFDTAVRQCEDTLFNMNLLEQVRSVAMLDQPLTNYRVLEQSAFHRYQENLPAQMELVNERLEALLKEHRKGERFWDAYDVWVMESYMRMLKMWLFHPDNPHSEAEQKQAWKALMTTCPSLKRLHHVRWKKMYRARKSYPLLLFFLRYFRSYALNRRVAAWLLRTNRY